MVNGAEGIDAQTFAAAGVKITHRNPVAAGGPATPKWSADGAVGNGARAGHGLSSVAAVPGVGAGSGNGRGMIDTRLPVTLLTGFLGAGKTTLLNAVLAENTAGRIAIIVNEFGEAGLDHDLIEAVREDIVLMRSGCLCCSIRGDLSRTIAALLERRSNGDIAFDRLVIETTGLADPGPILQTLVVDRLLSRAVPDGWGGHGCRCRQRAGHA